MKMKITEYRAYIKMSSYKKHLLVEGKDDWEVFSNFIDQLTDQVNSRSVKKSIFIDRADVFIESGLPSNREKVEMACSIIEGTPESSKILGFVDREFREFQLDPIIVDRINKHYQSGLVVWSRGHSVENYLFDPLILRETFRDVSDTDFKYEALTMFEVVFNSAMYIACTISLVALMSNNISKLKNSLDWQFIEIQNDTVQFNLQEWLDHIKKTYSFLDTEIESIKNMFIEFYEVAKKSPLYRIYLIMECFCSMYL
jgi:hypothetical protein